MPEERVYVDIGATGCKVMPHSEVCMHMKVAGKEMFFQVISARCVQLYDLKGKEFSAPILLSEAGIHHEADGPMYYYVDPDAPPKETLEEKKMVRAADMLGQLESAYTSESGAFQTAIKGLSKLSGYELECLSLIIMARRREG